MAAHCRTIASWPKTYRIVVVKSPKLSVNDSYFRIARCPGTAAPVRVKTLRRGYQLCGPRREAIEIDGSLDARDCAVAYKKGGRTLAIVTIPRDLQSLQIEADM